jgi:L,D-transpeptidase ErfK/SrfK
MHHGGTSSRRLSGCVPALILGAAMLNGPPLLAETQPTGAAALLSPEPLILGTPTPAPIPASTTSPVAPKPLPPKPVAIDSAAPADPASPRVRLVLDRRQRLLTVFEGDKELRRFPVAVGMVGWETPTGRFTVLEKQVDPVWEHPESGKLQPAGPANPLGSRWIGFHRDCSGRKGWDGDRVLDVKGCVVAGFHGTPHRWTVGRAVSHGCVRLYDEDVRTLFDLVPLGSTVTVLP